MGNGDTMQDLRARLLRINGGALIAVRVTADSWRYFLQFAPKEQDGTELELEAAPLKGTRTRRRGARSVPLSSISPDIEKRARELAEKVWRANT